MAESEARFERKCAKCGISMWYHTKKGMAQAEAYGSTCRKCKPLNKKHDNAFEEGILRLQSKGKNNVEIAIEMETSPSIVSKVLHKNGLKSTYDTGKLSDTDIARLKEMFELKIPDKEVAEIMQMTPRAVLKYRYRMGYKVEKVKEFNERKAVVAQTKGTKIQELHASGFTISQICSRTATTLSIVAALLKDYGLEPNAPTVNYNEKTPDGWRCYVCQEVRPEDHFMHPISSKCKNCIKLHNHSRIDTDIKAYFQYKLASLRKRSREQGVPFGITAKTLCDLFDEQKGKCFYTGQDLIPRPIDDYSNTRRAVSVDKVVPEYGYVPENVVLCTMQANSIKQDMTLKDLFYWLHPRIYDKIIAKVWHLIMRELPVI